MRRHRHRVARRGSRSRRTLTCPRPIPASARSWRAPVARILVGDGAADAAGAARNWRALASRLTRRGAPAGGRALRHDRRSRRRRARARFRRATAESRRPGSWSTAGGVTLLEACVFGRPIVALALRTNQRAGGARPRRKGAVTVAIPDSRRRGGPRSSPTPTAGSSSPPPPAERPTPTARPTSPTCRAPRRGSELRPMTRPRSTLCVIQARTGSTRLPGRCRRTSAAARSCASCSTGSTDLRVTTSWSRRAPLDRDDAVVDIAFDAGCQAVRFPRPTCSTGSGALTAYSTDHVIRLTADCPLAGPVVIEAVIARHLDRGADYTSNVFPRTFPRGSTVRGDRPPSARPARTPRPSIPPSGARDASLPPAAAGARWRTGNDVALGREGWTVPTPTTTCSFVRGIVDRVAAGRTPATTSRGAKPSSGGRPQRRRSRHGRVRAHDEQDRASSSRARRPTPSPTAARAHDRHEEPRPTRSAPRSTTRAYACRVATVRARPWASSSPSTSAAGSGEVGVAVATTFRGQGFGTALLKRSWSTLPRFRRS